MTNPKNLPPLSAVTLEEAKQHLRVEHNLDDAYIMSLCQAYTIVAEHEMGRPIFGEGGLDNGGRTAERQVLGASACRDALREPCER